MGCIEMDLIDEEIFGDTSWLDEIMSIKNKRSLNKKQ